ncbi:MAG TPA: preprotein translocase subunit SecE [Gemmatimonadales bacterium]|nr:preprotein translocase subunit SecE [Gemmatimonadales bacterium]
MADEIATTAGNPGRIAKIRDFLLHTRAEVDKVSWPAQPELIQSTRAVILGAIILGVAIGLVDKILQMILVGGVAMLTR